MGDATLQRAVGALVGVHAGDALGAAVEFDSAESIEARYPGGLREIVGGGPFGWAPGEPTDDTDLTWAVVRGYLDDAEDVVAAAGRYMVEWYRKGPRDIGGTTAQALAALHVHGDPARSGVDAEHTQANGSLMRTMPVAVARLRDPARRRTEARAVSAVTHAHPVCRAACAAYCDLAADLIAGADPAGAVDAAWRSGSHEQVTEALHDAMRTDQVSDLAGPKGGYVLWSLRLAVWALVHIEDFEEGVVAVVRTGGDTDTNGAIAGGLLGAHHGAEAIPTRWRERLHLGPELENAAASLLGLS